MPQKRYFNSLFASAACWNILYSGILTCSFFESSFPASSLMKLSYSFCVSSSLILSFFFTLRKAQKRFFVLSEFLKSWKLLLYQSRKRSFVSCEKKIWRVVARLCCSWALSSVVLATKVFFPLKQAEIECACRKSECSTPPFHVTSLLWKHLQS